MEICKQSTIVILFKNFIDNYKIVDKTILVATSGGVDSVTLVFLCKYFNLNFSIAHCNFNLRGQESIDDEKFVNSLADRYGVNRFLKSFSIKGDYVGSTQMIARELRYKWFEEISELHRFDHIFTAHHLNDSIETAINNICRGTGISGLVNFYNNNNTKLLRPLVKITKQEILNYAQNNGLTWREDSSNAKNLYKRNFIRNEIVPSIKKINPSIENTFNRNLERWNEEKNLLEMKLAELELKYTVSETNRLTILIEEISNKSFFKIFIYNVAKKFGFLYERIASFIDKNPQIHSKIYSKTHCLQVERQYWTIIEIVDSYPKNKPFTKTISLPKEIGDQLSYQLDNETLLLISLHPISFFESFATVSTVAYLDHAQFSDKIQVRTWMPGDRFIPIGMQSSKKISHFLTDLKLTYQKRKETLVLLHLEEIAWILGLRISEKFKIHENTTKVYRLELKKSLE